MREEIPGISQSLYDSVLGPVGELLADDLRDLVPCGCGLHLVGDVLTHLDEHVSLRLQSPVLLGEQDLSVIDVLLQPLRVEVPGSPLPSRFSPLFSVASLRLVHHLFFRLVLHCLCLGDEYPRTLDPSLLLDRLQFLDLLLQFLLKLAELSLESVVVSLLLGYDGISLGQSLLESLDLLCVIHVFTVFHPACFYEDYYIKKARLNRAFLYLYLVKTHFLSALESYRSQPL